MKKESSGAALMKTKSSGAHVHEKRASEPELCHFYDGSPTLLKMYSMFGSTHMRVCEYIFYCEPGT